METITRDKGERLEDSVTRYEKTRVKQLNEGFQQISGRHHALTILRYCGLTICHLHQIMLDINHQIPNIEMAYIATIAELRKEVSLDRRELRQSSQVDP